MTISESVDEFHCYCDNKYCVVPGDMPRYFHKYYKHNSLLFLREFICKDIHVRADYEQSITVVSHLNVIFLDGSFKINYGMNFDFNDVDKLYDKLKNVMMLS